MKKIKINDELKTVIRKITDIEDEFTIEQHLDSKYDPCIQISSENENLLLNIHTLTYLFKEWIQNNNVSEMICSHKTLYTCTDGYAWYVGYAHIQTTYDDKQTVRDIGKGNSELEAVVNAAYHLMVGGR